MRPPAQGGAQLFPLRTPGPFLTELKLPVQLTDIAPPRRAGGRRGAGLASWSSGALCDVFPDGGLEVT